MLTSKQIADLESANDPTIYRIAGEQERRADTIKLRDNANRRANDYDRRAKRSDQEAARHRREAAEHTRKGSTSAAAASLALADRETRKAAAARALASQERARAESMHAPVTSAKPGALAKCKPGSRRLRREASRAAARVRAARRTMPHT